MGKSVSSVKYTGAWSWSKLRDFENCRAMFKRRHIEKLKEPESRALTEGSAKHDAIEQWFKGWYKPKELKALQQVLGTMRPTFEKLKSKQPFTEQMWAHAKDWSALENGFDKTAWIRAKTDAHLVTSSGYGKTGYVFDWKTGRPKPMGQDQMRFYAMLMMLRYPGVEHVKLELWYIDHDKILDDGMDRAALSAVRKEFTRRANRIYNEVTWSEEPGLDCKWCPFRKSIGGPCSF